ncbi:MAG: ClpXP protease specificity-enhancing factor SspB [Pseudomonadota bacterium]
MADPNTLNYGQLMQKAMRRMTAEVLGQVAEYGLPGDHHFYITFETGHPGVDIPDWLRETYPDEMTIVLQDWFRDLAVTQDRFSVTLNFSDQPQTLVVPLDAIRTFVDPSVKFGVKFDAQDADGPGIGDIETELETADHDTGAVQGDADAEFDEIDRDTTTPDTSADVVSLDQFRKP